MKIVSTLLLGFIGIIFNIVGQLLSSIIPAVIVKIFGGEDDTVKLVAFWGIAFYLVIVAIKNLVSSSTVLLNFQDKYNMSKIKASFIVLAMTFFNLVFIIITSYLIWSYLYPYK